MRKLLLAMVAIACTAGAVLPLRADVIVVPNGLAAVEGNSNNAFPFNIANPSQRYQQVFGASDFAVLSGPQLITQIAFRPDAVTGNAFSSTLPDVQINFSTTSRAPDALSSTFADNVGSDDSVVFSGPLSLSSSDTGPAAGPKNFDIVINLTTPFLYDPGTGNLLFDVRNFGGGRTTQFDAHEVFLDSVSRLWSVSSNGVNDTTGSSDSSGLVARFTTQAVTTAIPEPSSLALLSLGALSLAGCGWRRRKGQQALAA